MIQALMRYKREKMSVWGLHSAHVVGGGSYVCVASFVAMENMWRLSCVGVDVFSMA